MTWRDAIRSALRGSARLNLPAADQPGPAAEGLDGGGRLIRASAMDARFRRFCAVYGNGRCLIAEGHEADQRLRLDLLALRRDGIVPAALREESASLREIAACWRAGAPGSAGTNGAAARRIGRLLEDAAAARASDVVFENGPDACRVHAIVNDRKLPLGPPLTPSEGRAVMGFLFHCKDEGSSQTSYRRASFQGFSIRAGGPVPLPGGISALRCQRGPHEPDADHLFARLFYRDRLDEGMTLQRLGFSDAEAALFAEIRMAMQGGVFIGGRAGDGKSTTMAVNLALQMAEMDGQLNLVTLEDPVEYRIPGAIQIAVPTSGSGEARAGHYKDALMHFCRVHPASGMVSEIRDADAARQVLQCVDTGHQIWTTIHVHNANAILFRLIDMGVGPAEVSKPGNVALLMKQTLLPQLCPACARTSAGRPGGAGRPRTSICRPGRGSVPRARGLFRMPPSQRRRHRRPGLERLSRPDRHRRDHPPRCRISAICARRRSARRLGLLAERDGRRAAGRSVSGRSWRRARSIPSTHCSRAGPANTNLKPSQSSPNR